MLGRVYWLITLVSRKPGWPPQTGMQAHMETDSRGSPPSETVALATADGVDLAVLTAHVKQQVLSIFQVACISSVWIHHAVYKLRMRTKVLEMGENLFHVSKVNQGDSFGRSDTFLPYNYATLDFMFQRRSSPMGVSFQRTAGFFYSGLLTEQG